MRNNNICKAEVSNCLEIAKLIKDGWDAAYKGIIPEEYLKNRELDKMSKGWKEKIETTQEVYVYKENNQILGVIMFGKARDFECEDTGEVFVLYVKVEEKRRGIGSKLIEFAKNKLIEAGYRKMIIWCLKGNIQGENFYKKHGGHKIRERDYIVGGINVREVGYMFDLKDEKEIN